MLVKCVLVLAFIVLDIITGFIKALYHGNIDSSAIRKGLLHKATEGIVLGVSILLEYGAVQISLGIDLPLSGVVTVYIVGMEATSIIENLCEVNPKLYKLFKPYLLKLQKGDDDDETKGN